MSTAVLDSDDICAICYSERKKDPVILDCGHSYCCDCLIELLQHTEILNPDSSFFSANQRPSDVMTSSASEMSPSSTVSAALAELIKCPQCRKPIAFRNIRETTCKANSRIEQESKRIQQEFRRQNPHLTRLTHHQTVPDGIRSRILVQSLISTIWALIQAAFIQMETPAKFHDGKGVCCPKEIHKTFNIIYLFFAVLGISFTQCRLWLRFRTFFVKCYRLLVILAILFTVSETSSASQSCTLFLSSAAIITTNIMIGILFFCISRQIEMTPVMNTHRTSPISHASINVIQSIANLQGSNQVTPVSSSNSEDTVRYQQTSRTVSGSGETIITITSD